MNMTNVIELYQTLQQVKGNDTIQKTWRETWLSFPFGEADPNLRLKNIENIEAIQWNVYRWEHHSHHVYTW